VQIRVELGEKGIAAPSAGLAVPAALRSTSFLLALVAALAAALTVGLRAATVQQPDLGWLTAELGASSPSAPAARASAGGFEVSTAGGAVHATRGSTHVAIATLGVGGVWRAHENGVTRATSFGSETITIGPRKTELYLRVDRRQGARTWSWLLQTNLAPQLLPSGAVELRGPNALRIAPVAIST